MTAPPGAFAMRRERTTMSKKDRPYTGNRTRLEQIALDIAAGNNGAVDASDLFHHLMRSTPENRVHNAFYRLANIVLDDLVRDGFLVKTDSGWLGHDYRLNPHPPQ